MSLRPPLTDLDNAINYSEIFEQLMLLEMSIYTPSKFILASKITKYADQYDDTIGLTQMGREQGIKRLMVINLMKRMESSVYSFTLTLKRIHEFIGNTIDSISAFEKTKKGTIEGIEQGFQNDFDDDDQNTDIFIIGKRVKIDIADMDYISWKKDLLKDYEILDLLISMSSDITPEHDTKLQTLISIIQKKLTKPINDNNKKIIVFTAFADTAEYVYKHISTYVKNSYALETAMVTGSIEGKTTIPKLKSDLNTVLTLFAPLKRQRPVDAECYR